MATTPLPWVKYAQQQAPASGDNIPPWEKYAGTATATPPAPTPAPEGGVGSFLKNMLPESIQHPQQAAQDEQQHPIRSTLESLPGVAPIEGLLSGAKRSGGELVEAGKSLLNHNPAEAAVHGIRAVPVVGPAMVNAAEKPDVGGTGSYLGDLKSVVKSPAAMGTLTGAAAEAAPAVLGGADMAMPERSLLGEVPTRAKAGRLFDSTMKVAKDQPVKISSATMQPLERTQQLAMAGGKPFGTADKLYQRTQSINPLTYGEARDFSSNMSLSPEEKMGLKKSMKYEVPRLSSAFNDDVQQAANDAGVGKQHAKAMKMYARGAKLEAAGKGALEYGGKAALYGAGADGLYRLGRAVSGK